jgi:type VI protein secretion system component VasK
MAAPKFRMKRSTFWGTLIPGIIGLGLLVAMVTWLQDSMGVAGERPHATLYLQLIIGGLWVLVWTLLFVTSRNQERRDAVWQAGAQARREAAIRAQMARMAEVHGLMETYGQDVGIAAYLLGEDPEEVKRVCG